MNHHKEQSLPAQNHAHPNKNDQNFLSILTNFQSSLLNLLNGQQKMQFNLQELSQLQQVKSQLDKISYLNIIYNENNRFRKIMKAKSVSNFQLEYTLYNDLDRTVDSFLKSLDSLDKIRLFLMNQKISEQNAKNFLKHLSSAAFMSSDFVLFYEQQESNYNFYSTNDTFTLNDQECEAIYKELKLFINDKKRVTIDFQNTNPNMQEFQNVFGLAKYFVLKHQNNNKTTFFVFEVNDESQCSEIIHKNFPEQTYNIMAEFIYQVFKELKNEVYSKSKIMWAIRAIKNYKLKHACQIIRDIIRMKLQLHLETDVNIITRDMKEFNQFIQPDKDQWELQITENNLTLPVGDNKDVSFLLKIKRFNLDIISFNDYITKLWRFSVTQVQRKYQHEIIMEIVESNCQKQIYFLFNENMQLIYQSIDLPPNFDLIEVPQIDDCNLPIDFDKLKMSQESRKVIQIMMKEFQEVKDKNFANAEQQQHKFDMVALRDEEGIIVGYILICEPSKNKREDMIGKDLDSSQTIIDNERIEKAAMRLIEAFNLQKTMKVDDLMNILKERQIENMLTSEHVQVSKEDLSNSYALEYYNATDLPFNIQPIVKSVHQKNYQKLMNQLQKSGEKFQDSTEKHSIINLKENDLELLKDWNFNILKITQLEEKYRIIWAMFHLCNFFEHLKIDKSIFLSFTQNLQKLYDHRDNPFHNLNHAITVSHCMFYCIKNKIFDAYLQNLEQFSLLFACLGHDIDHTGRTNAFESARLSKIALRYNDESVLEQHHIATLFKVLLKKDCNVLQNLSDQDFATVRKFTISNILATDMKKHFDIVKTFEKKVAQFKEDGNPIVTNEADRKLLSGFLVHTADLSGPARTFEIAKVWSLKISQEFTNQVQDEEKLGLPVTSYLRGLTSVESVAKQEVNFIKAIIRPVWVVLNQLDSERLSHGLKYVDENIILWEKTYEEEKSKREKSDKEKEEQQQQQQQPSQGSKQ